MKTATQRTAGIWKWKQTRGNNEYEHNIYSDWYDIALLGMEDTGERNPSEIKANAEFICKAVNEYDHLKEVNQELLKILKSVQFELKQWHGYNLNEVESFSGNEAEMQLRNANDIGKLCENVKQAIKLAESKDHV